MFKKNFVTAMMAIGLVIGLIIGLAMGYVMGAGAKRDITQCGIVAIEKGPFGMVSYVLNPRGWKACHVSTGDTVWEYAQECTGFMRDYVDVREVVELILDYNDMRSEDLLVGEIIYLPF